MAEADLPPLIQQMQQPEFYPHAVAGGIELIQTHISYILLAGDYAYKVKKPKDLGFLDFSTLAKRQHYCHQELRLNQPTAPDIYLAVLPIAQAGEQFALDGSGEPVEYAVQMRQFPQDSLLSEQFERGELTGEWMVALGETIARFHTEAATSDYIASFGRPSQVRQAFDENYAQTERYIDGPQTAQQYRETKAFTDRFFERDAALLEQRQANGCIRECHGDLHLRNLCWWRDKIQLFDRIEFNEAFRFVDVICDVAFAVMDVEARGRRDWANRLLNTYLERTGDWEGAEVLPLYLSRQAYVRAKVASLLLDDPNVSAAERQQAQARAAHYYRLAWQYTQTGRGRLILMSGRPGSGKSTVASEIAQRLGAIHLRSDAVRKHLAGVPLEARGGPELYTGEMTGRTYNRLRALGLRLAERGFAVVLDATYARQGQRQPVVASARERQFPLHIYHCTAPLEVMRQRLAQRQGDVSDATPELLEQQSAPVEAFSETEQYYLQQVDTTDPAWRSQLALE